LLAVLALGCANNNPPPIQDSDGSVPEFDDDSYRPPVFVEGGSDADAGPTTTEVLDFQGTCATQGDVAVWHYFDFETHTPENSALVFFAQTADTEDALANAPNVSLATVTGADVTNWTGVDVDAKLQTIAQASRLFLRVSVNLVSASDGTPPALVHYRQEYDCIAE
jgi:hypothetical protein